MSGQKLERERITFDGKVRHCESASKDIKHDKAEAPQELDQSNKAAAKVTVPCCVSFSLVVCKRVHGADCDANAAGSISLLPWRKTRRRRRRHRRNMTNS